MRSRSRIPACLPALTALLAASPFQDEPRLAAGYVKNAELRGGGSHTFVLPLRSGEFVSAMADQRGVDVEVTLSAPDGTVAAHSDLPNSDQGPEPVVAIAETAGDYRLLIRVPNAQAPAGRYELRVEAIRPATAEDRRRVEAERLIDDARTLIGKRTATAMAAAIEKNRVALTYFQSSGDRYRQALTLKQIGLLLALTGEFRQALASYEPALELYRTLGDGGGVASTLNNMGGALDVLGEAKAAMEHLQGAVAGYRAVGQPVLAAGSLSNIAKLYADMSDWALAISIYRETLPIFEKAGDRRRQAATLGNLAAASLHTDPETAIDYNQKALLLHRAIGDRNEEGRTLANLASAVILMNRFQDGINYGEQALALYRGLGNRAGVARTLRTLGWAYAKQGEPDRGLGLIDEAIAGDRAIGDKREEAIALNARGMVLALAGAPGQARDAYRLGADIAGQLGDLKIQAASLHGIAGAESDLGNMAEAQRNVETSLGLIEKVRTNSGGDEARAGFLSASLERYEFYIDLLMRQHQEAEALAASERSRARSLVEMLAESGVDIREGVDPKLLEREREISNLLNLKGARLLPLGARDTPQAAALKAEVRKLESEYQDVQAAIRKDSPNYAALTQPSPLNVKQIQGEVLDADSVLLEYSLGEKRSYLWAVTKRGLSAWALPPRARIEAQVAEVYALLTARTATKRMETPAARQKRIGEADAALPEAALRLSEMVIAPAAAAIEGKRLVIVPDGALQRMPFAMLPVPGSREPLVTSHELAVLPSASALAVLRNEIASRKPAPKMVAVFADPVFDRSGAAPSPEATRLLEHLAGDTQTIPRLPFTAIEADQILRVAGGSGNWKATGYQANRAAAIGGQLGQYRYVHFATHGILDTERPSLSALVLSQVDEKKQPLDGFLRVTDVYNTKLAADLVVLSACQTGLGKEVRGEGLMGLTRAFLYAGAPRVVVSLWNVNDRATADLMTALYRGMLREGKTPAAALRAAQLEMRKHKGWESPYFWAAFVQHGEWR